MANEDTGQGVNYTVEKPHPRHGIDPNIINEFGHTMYPKFVHKFDDKGRITFDKVILTDEKGKESMQHPVHTHHSKIVQNEDEEEAANGDGFFVTHIEAKAANKVASTKKPTDKPVDKPVGWDAKK
jgi:hypothetical protein